MLNLIVSNFNLVILVFTQKSHYSTHRLGNHSSVLPRLSQHFRALNFAIFGFSATQADDPSDFKAMHNSKSSRKSSSIHHKTWLFEPNLYFWTRPVFNWKSLKLDVKIRLRRKKFDLEIYCLMISSYVVKKLWNLSENKSKCYYLDKRTLANKHLRTKVGFS